MIQFNLLPDIKIKYIKARRQKRMIVVTSVTASLVCAGLAALMAGFVYGVQGAQIASMDKTITSSLNSIKTKQTQVDDINKVLTVQNQLDSLDSLHAEKPITSRIFEYLAKLKPQSVTITKITVNVVDGENTMLIEGDTQVLESVNTFIDTLKFSKFSTETIEAAKAKAEQKDDDQKNNQSDEVETVGMFSDVVLADFTRDQTNATYTITMKYDPLIFSSTVAASNIVVPKDFISTRSSIETPILQDGLINSTEAEE